MEQFSWLEGWSGGEGEQREESGRTLFSLGDKVPARGTQL